MLGGPRGFVAARRLVDEFRGSNADLEEEVRAEAARHPRDLRWARLLFEPPAPPPPAQVVEVAWTEADLAACPDPSAAFRAIVRDRKRDNGARDAETSCRVAGDPRWTEDQACTLWMLAANDACDARRRDLLAEALDQAWRHGLLPVPRESIYEDPIDPERSLTWNRAFKPLIYERLSAGDAPLHVWFFAHLLDEPDGAVWPGVLDPTAHLFAEGWFEGHEYRDEPWARHVAKAPDATALVGEYLRSLRTHAELCEARDTVEQACQRLLAAKREGDAIAIVDAWAERCGPVSPRDEFGFVG